MPADLGALQFNTDLVQQGMDGGKKAANALRNAVLEQCSDLSEDIEVIAKVCANVSGLGNAMKRDGCLENPEDLRDFTLGFTQGKASFDFVDVGHGKERADSMIKGLAYPFPRPPVWNVVADFVSCRSHKMEFKVVLRIVKSAQPADN
jgi:hypothetical protein